MLGLKLGYLDWKTLIIVHIYCQYYNLDVENNHYWEGRKFHFSFLSLAQLSQALTSKIRKFVDGPVRVLCLAFLAFLIQLPWAFSLPQHFPNPSLSMFLPWYSEVPSCHGASEVSRQRRSLWDLQLGTLSEGNSLLYFPPTLSIQKTGTVFVCIIISRLYSINVANCRNEIMNICK